MKKMLKSCGESVSQSAAVSHKYELLVAKSKASWDFELASLMFQRKGDNFMQRDKHSADFALAHQFSHSMSSH